MITTIGLHRIVGLIGDTDTPVDFTYIAFGSGTTAPAAADITLESETQRKVATMKIKSIINAHDTISYTANFTATELGTATEIGVFTLSAGGSMLLRTLVVSPINYPKGAILTVTAEATVKNFACGKGADW